MSDLTVPATIAALEELLSKMKGEQTHSGGAASDPPATDQPPDDDERSLTIAGFCAVETISKSYYFDLRRRGLAPDETRVPDSNLVRITPAARAAWHERMKTLAQSKDAGLERQRRTEHARIAGVAAALSPVHVSRRGPRTAKAKGRRAR